MNRQRTYPARVNLRRLFCEFLDEFVFEGKVPVFYDHTRNPMETPLGVYVNHMGSKTSMAGFDYDANQNTGFLDNEAYPSPSITNAIYCTGVVDIDVVSTSDDYVDKHLGIIIAELMSEEGRCWFSEREDIVVHGYNIVETQDFDFSTELDGKVNILFSGIVKVEVEYDLSTTKEYNYIKSIRERKSLIDESEEQ